MTRASSDEVTNRKGIILSYNLKVVNRGPYLHVNVEGSNSAKAVLDYLREVKDACLQHKCNKVLIEENLQGPSLKTLEIFEVVTKGAENMRPALIQVAFIDTNKQHGQIDKMEQT